MVERILNFRKIYRTRKLPAAGEIFENLRFLTEFGALFQQFQYHVVVLNIDFGSEVNIELLKFIEVNLEVGSEVNMIEVQHRS